MKKLNTIKSLFLMMSRKNPFIFHLTLGNECLPLFIKQILLVFTASFLCRSKRLIFLTSPEFNFNHVHKGTLHLIPWKNQWCVYCTCAVSRMSSMKARFNDTLPLFKDSSWEWLSAKSLQVADLPRTVKEKISETKNSQDI